MKILIPFLTIIFLLIAGGINAQKNYSIKHGPIQKGAYYPSKFIGKLENRMIFRSSKAKLLASTNGYIEVYDENMKLQFVEELNFKNNKENLDYEGIYKIGESIFQFGSDLKKGEGKNILYCREVKIQKIKLAYGSWKKISETSFTKKWRAGEFDIYKSKNDSLILVVSNLEYKKGEKEKFNLGVFDFEMNKLWNENVILPYNDELFYINDFIVSNSAKVFMSGELGTPKVKRRNSEKQKSMKTTDKPGHYILTFLEGSEEPNKYKVELKNKYIIDLKLELNDEENLICVGFYGKNENYGFDGTFYVKIDDEKYEIKASTFKEFDMKFITMYEKEKTVKKMNKKAQKGTDYTENFYRIVDVKFLPEGGTVLLAEESYSYVVCTSSPNGGTTCRTYYVSNDIIIIKYGKDGEVEFSSKIHKTGTMQTPLFQSFNYIFKDNKIYIIYNDHIKNDLIKNPVEYKAYNKYNKGSVVVQEIDEEGKLTRSKLYDYKKTGILIPEIQYQDGNKLIMYSMKGKKRNLVEMTVGK